MLESLFSKVAGLRPATILKEAPTQLFSCEIYEILKNPFCYRTPPVAATLYKNKYLPHFHNISFCFLFENLVCFC